MSSLETISSNALFITFPVSDGDVSRRPDNMKEPSESASEVNWYRMMLMDEKYACRWRNIIGQGIAKLLNKPEKEKYCLKNWPEGYCLLDHNKGVRANPRHDLYLFGSKHALRFRSPAEFIPHGFWLLTDPALDKKNCGCKYCGGGGGGKRTQTEISEALGLPTNRGPTVIPRMRAGDMSRRRPQKSFSKTLPPLTLPPDSPWIAPSLRQPPCVADHWHLKSANLTFASSNTRISDLTSTRRFRVGELVWCPFEEEKGNTYSRPYWPYWPSIIIDAALYAEAEVFDTNNGVYSVVQTRRYWVLRLGALSEDDRRQFEFLLDEADVVPWHAFPLNADLATMVPNEQATSFALGILTAKRLLTYWAVFNRYHTKVEKSVQVSSLRTDRLPESTPTIPNSSRTTTPISAFPDQEISQRGPVRLCSSIKRNATSTSWPYALPPRINMASQPSRSNTEIRYEGLWYGAERIWIGDTVRLCPEREAFSSSLDSSWGDRPRPIPSPGAHRRAVIMRIDKLYVVNDENERKECIIAGPLFEIARGEALDFETEQLYNRASSPASSESDAGPTRPWDTSTIPPIPSCKVPTATPPTPFPLPPAPSGYVTKPLLPPGTELPVPLSFVAGRYYPDILEWLSPNIVLSASSSSKPSAVATPSEPNRDSVSGHEPTTQECIHSLCGLAPGRYNPATCIDVSLADRSQMVEDAGKLAKMQLTSIIQDMDVS